MKTEDRYRYSKIVYERHLNDHPIKGHPLYKVWLKSTSVKLDRWGAWMREKNRPAFDTIYAKWKERKVA